MLRIALIQPGSTDFDEQGRIKGTLDVPLSENGTHQVARIVGELADMQFEIVYTSPSESAVQTAEALATDRGVKVKTVENLHNLDHGLWHGKLIEEVKQTQPKVYRQWQENPESIRPPDGESLDEAQRRVDEVLTKIIKKYKDGVVALVVPEPLASLVRSAVDRRSLGDLWKAECDSCRWELLDVLPEKSVSR